jgi:hypothetical protein
MLADTQPVHTPTRYAKSLKVAVSIPDEVTGIFN